MTRPEIATVLIADDHAFTLAGMQQSLGEDPRFHVVATARCGIDMIRLARQLRPGLALVDYVMPDASGLDVLIELRRWTPATRVVIVTGREDAEIVPPLLDAGAAGVLSKSTPIAAIRDALARIVRGETVLDDAFRTVAAANAPDLNLTAREHEVLVRIARGMANPAIAKDLGLSPKTVESHRAGLMRKLGVNSTATLMLAAARAGLITI
ncbi:MAG: response regulator transcription factor [Rhodobacteraceae bacterium]|nr:response regulator transcription factor [Paracoccaceae bacterium]